MFEVFNRGIHHGKCVLGDFKGGYQYSWLKNDAAILIFSNMIM